MMIQMHEELNQYQPITTDINQTAKQRENTHAFRFLSALRSEYEPIKSQILGSSEFLTYLRYFLSFNT
jgi:hypothetical protein